MNDLDKQLAELALLTKAELPPNPSATGTLGKKIGPAVPPKPKKPQPQIPQSYQLKQTVEPSYSSRLQSTQFYSNLPPQNTYSNAPTLPLNSSNYANLPRPQTIKTVNITPKPYTKPDHVTYSNIQVGQSRNQDGLIYSNLIHPPRDGNVYSNVPPGNVYANGDDLPPPPPPLEIGGDLGGYAPCTINTNLPPPPEDLLPPPSPVSSSYSELRRATQPGAQDFNYSLGSQYAESDSLYGYGAMSQSSSTYESIYEAINPRPPSQMSSRSNYSLYAPYVSGNTSTMTGPSQSASRMEVNKLQEVDSLTDLLVQGMDNEQDQDVYGVCVKCGEKIIGENSGCTAMDQLYHTKCFTCHHCAINLQGKPFYALDGNPYCEEDYLNTLEKCCVCQKPILDRILRATGKPYHPKCFCCVVCGKSLDGIPFTVDATNRVHCIEDFHKIFAPRCWVCKQPIMPEPGEEETVRVVALDHSFHIQCYKCEDCGLVLSSEADGRGCYPLDGHVLCKSCNAKRVQALTNHMTTELSLPPALKRPPRLPFSTMSVHTILLDFSVDPSTVKNESQVSVVCSNIENVLREYLTNLKTLSTIPFESDLLKLYSSDAGVSATLRVFRTGIITLNIEYLKVENQEPQLSFERCKEINRDITERVDGIKRSYPFVPIKRGTFKRYFPSSDDRLLEYDIDELVFEERTPYQKIQIVHSKSLGNMLVLDDLQNISEADLIYTETLMGKGVEKYKDKEIVILGGGDGALLYELLKEEPKEVIMLEIDEVVMKACAKHMRSICGTVLDRMSGPNYEIIVGDCIKAVEQYIKEGRKFDYVFGDLTDVPLSESPTGELWDFINKILSMSFKILKPDGKFMTHVIGSAAGDALKMYETQLMKLQPPVKFTTSHAFIPSFLEDWVFYQVFCDKKQ